MSDKKLVPIPGSERAPLPGARAVAPADPSERVEVTVLLRPSSSLQALAAPETLTARLPSERRYVSRKEFERAHGASPDDIAQVETFAQDNHLDVVQISPGARTIRLSGTVGDLSAAFGVELQQYEYAGGTHRGRTGAIHVPASLAGIVEGVFGLDNRPAASPHFRRLPDEHSATLGAQASMAFKPTQVAQLYDFPATFNGAGQSIGIIELGGGYRAKDLTKYFAGLGIHKPKVVAVSVAGGHNHPSGDLNSADGEVMLDIEVAGAVAPGAQIVVYFAPNTDDGFLNAIKTAIHDDIHKPSVISISWGASESGPPNASWTQQAMQAFNETFQAAAALGVTICCAAGDNGSSDGVNDGLAHVDFPASSPFVLACGGTHLEGTGTTITQESVWNDGSSGGATGGGVSQVFGLPTYQAEAGVPPSANSGGQPGRGVPDVAGDADPQTGYQVLVDGRPAVIGGTSAVAPLYAGLIALVNQALAQPVGFLNPLLYNQAHAAGAFHEIVDGNNGAYQAHPGWNACAGLGSIDGAKLLSALGGKS